jgi:hypothetical protein
MFYAFVFYQCVQYSNTDTCSGASNRSQVGLYKREYPDKKKFCGSSDYLRDTPQTPYLGELSLNIRWLSTEFLVVVNI